MGHVKISIDTLTRFLTYSQPVWHQKERPGKHQELEITENKTVMSQCWMGLFFVMPNWQGLS